MSNSRSGFFSLNRLLGRKNKNEKNRDKLSKPGLVPPSTAATLEVIGPQNQIKPLTVVPNAPFEQTFRITVLLPHGQLYVARIGARMKLNELLDMIATNKLLDADKFEFRHPTDEEQIFDLNATIGEVGLSEIKLVPKQSSFIKEKPTLRYRMHQQQAEMRPIIRPHTMATVSPYSSTNSLNSSDSSGFISNQRFSNGVGIPSAPNRKKRIAPRPPSQNSIPENTEHIKVVPSAQTDVNDGETVTFKQPLNRQNFHASSPNLSSNNGNTLQLYTPDNNETKSTLSMSSSFNHKQDEVNYKKILNRPLSMQANESLINDQRPPSTSTISDGSRTHSRTSSEVSDITKDRSQPEPAQRKKIPTPKKKAPIPPPRTISAISTSKIALHNLKEEQNEVMHANDNGINGFSGGSNAAQGTAVTINLNNASNVSKVMLNIDANGNESTNKTDDKVSTCNGNIPQYNGESETGAEQKQSAVKTNISKTQITHRQTEEQSIDAVLNVPQTKIKKTSVVSLNVEHNEVFIIPPNEVNGNITNRHETIDTEHISKEINEIINQAVNVHEAKLNDDISEQIDEIIHQAIEINETQLNAVNELKNEQNGISHEINNNIDETCTPKNYDSSVWNCNDGMSKVNKTNDKHIDECSTRGSTPVSTEYPIKPILNEMRTFDFVNDQFSDHSLPTSTASTTNTMENLSTGPESIITSDIEDGYKGNDDKQINNKIDINREEFIESQFGFLSEHLDGKTSLDSISDDEKTFNPIEKHDVISSTMIECNKTNNKTFTVPDKDEVINELTHIINCNRLDTFVKPCVDNNDNKKIVDNGSALSNFHIGAYTNGNHENIKTINVQSQQDAQPESMLIENKTEIDNKQPKITSFVPKQVNRSMSFHSTYANTTETVPIEQNNGIHLSLAPRSTSYVSLINVQKEKTLNGTMSVENELKNTQKSSSELSIADIPSLQSLEVMKSILSTSFNFDRMVTAKKPIKTPVEPKLDEQTELEPTVEKTQHKTETIERKPTVEIKTNTWKYEGPPAINLSTWGERPKSEVFIKSDNDYIFGGVSKVAALQKRFSANQNGLNLNDEHDKRDDKRCNGEPYKLPIVRGVEYKKNIELNNKSSKTMNKINDPIEDKPMLGSNYPISHIVREKSFPDKAALSSYKVMTLNRCSIPVPPKPINDSITKSNTIQRVQSFNVQSSDDFDGSKQCDYKSNKEINTSTNNEKPMFSQFALRKTGLKEKIFEENNFNAKNVISNNNNNNNNNNNSNINRIEKPAKKVNPIPTAPKPPQPPPLLKPTIKKSISLNAPVVDTRDQLLNSIRNFNRDTLKRNRIN